MWMTDKMIESVSESMKNVWQRNLFDKQVLDTQQTQPVTDKYLSK